MKLKVKKINLATGGKFVAVLHKEDAGDLGVRALDAIVITKGNKKVAAVVDVTDKFIKIGQIALFDELRDYLKLRTGEVVTVERRKELESEKYIRKKIEGGELGYKEMRQIVDDVLERQLDDIALAALVTGLHINGMSKKENAAMSKAMIETSKKIKFSGTVVDKHSIGGVPGDKTSMLFVPIIASTGLKIPKTSSRSITSPAGTADRVEVLMPVNLGTNQIKNVVHKCGGCLVWGGAVDLAPADDLFIHIEHNLEMDPLLIPSVMSKKYVVGSKFVVIDIPTGPEAKVKTKAEAEKLAEDFMALGKNLGMKVECGITRGDQPVGYCMGPALEAREALETIMNRRNNPDLVDKTTSLAGLLLTMTGKGNKKTALGILRSGKAEKKLREMIKAQGGNPKITPEDIPYAKYRYTLKSECDGIVTAMSNKTLVSICRVAGTPKDKYAGIMLNKKIQDVVKKGEPLLTIFAEKKEKLQRAEKLAKEVEIFTILGHKENKMLMEKVIKFTFDKE
jgi:AMP phosphorylase